MNAVCESRANTKYKKMKTSNSHLKNTTRFKFWFIAGLLLLWGITNAFAQEARVTSKVDSTRIRIGEQIHFEVQIETDTTAQVVFPEGQTFAPLEMVEAQPVDSLIEQDKLRLIKKYALTQFDSGSYTLPRQQILVNNKPFFTDSLRIEVGTVAVDTLQQKMYDIKPLVEVDKSRSGWWKYIVYPLIFLLVGGAIFYWFVLRKKPLTEDEKIALLPPYDRALMELKRLDESKYLIQSEYKQYYSQLTNIVRSYLEEDVHITALESTTDELIEKLEMLKDSGSLKIDEETLGQFQRVLKTADLVKFARSIPDNSVIQGDRKAIEHIVVKTKEGLPEPTEEDLRLNEEYLEIQAKKKQKRKLIIGSITAVAVLVFTFIGFGFYYGFGYVKDTIIGHPTKELLDAEWIASDYGYPPIHLETPKVLKRMKLPIPEEMGAVIKDNQAFAYGSLLDNFYILTSVTTYQEGIQFDMDKAMEGSIASMEQNGAKNMIVKQDQFKTLTGTSGVKVFGTFETVDPKTKKEYKSGYVILGFVQNGGFQQVIVVHRDGDPYADKIIQRISDSINFKAASS